MQLRNARLCLDCEELHEGPQCPACASESFAFLTRWVPADERRHRQRVRPRGDAKRPVGRKWVTGGVAGLTLVAIGRWLMRPGSSDEPGRPPGGDPLD